MSQKLYFEADDNGQADNSDLWVTDGMNTDPVGGIGDMGVSDAGVGGLGPSGFTILGQKMLFGGSDALETDSANGLWLTDGTPGGTTEIGGVSPGSAPGAPAPAITDANPEGLSPTGFVTFGSKAIFFGNDGDGFTGLWVTDGTQAGTIELGGLQNAGIVGKGLFLSPENISAFNDDVLFDAIDGDAYKGLWISDGTTDGTVEIGGPKNAEIVDSGATNFIANNFITLGAFELFNAPNAEGDNALWITDGTAPGTVEIGGMNNAGIVGADNTDLGDGLANAIALGARVFFAGNDNSEDTGLWTTDGTADDTIEIGGLGDAELKSLGQHPSSLGLKPTDLTVNGPDVLFNGQDALGFNELWVSDGTDKGTFEIGGEAGALLNEAVGGLNPNSIVSLGNGMAVFVGYDDKSNGTTGEKTLWVTNGTEAGTMEIGGQGNDGVADIQENGGFVFSSDDDSIIGGDGLAYFMGMDSDGNNVLWETDGTLAGTKIVTSGDAPSDGIAAFNMTMGAVPTAQSSYMTSATITLEDVPGESVNLVPSSASSDTYTVTGSNGTVNLISTVIGGTTIGATAALIGGGLLVKFVGTGSSATLSNTNGNKDTIYGSKGAVTLSDAQADAYGVQRITFATGTTGNVVYLFDTGGANAIVGGSNGTIYLDSAQAAVSGGGNTINFLGGTGNAVTIEGTNGAFDKVNGSNGTIYLSSGQASVTGGGDVIDFYTGTGNVASLINTAGSPDYVDASSGVTGTVYLSSAVTTVVGGGDTIDFYSGTGDVASLVSTAGSPDYVEASSGVTGTVYLTNAVTTVVGGGDVVDFYSGTGNVASLVSTAGDADYVEASTGVTGTVYLSSAQTIVVGGGDVVDFYSGTGNVASLVSTAGNADYVEASTGVTGTVYLSSAQTIVVGGGDTIDFYAGTGNVASLMNTAGSYDLVTATNGTTGKVYLSSAQASVVGGGDTIDLYAGTGDVASLLNTAGSFDLVTATNGTTGVLYLSAAQTSVVGGGDTIDFYSGAGNVASLLNTAGSFDLVTATNSTTGVLYFSAAQASVVGGGDTIDFYSGAGNVASLLNTGSSADTVTAASGVTGTLYLSNAAANVSGGGDKVDFYSGTGNVANLSGSSYATVFSQPAFGLDTIGGFNSSDTMQLSKTDFANWSALSSHITQSGANTLITLDANDVIKLTNVQATSLTQGQFSFV